MKVVNKKSVVYAFVFMLFFLFSCSKDKGPKEEEPEEEEPEEMDEEVMVDLMVELGRSQQEHPVKVLNDENFIYVIGDTQSELDDSNKSDFTDFHGGFYDVYIAKLNLSGDIIWEKTFGTIQGERAVDAMIAEDGDLVVIGQRADYSVVRGAELVSVSSTNDRFAWKIDDADGERVWENTLNNDRTADFSLGGVVEGHTLYHFYAGIFGTNLKYRKIDLSTGSTVGSDVPIDGENMSVTRIRRVSDGFLLIGAQSNEVAILKLAADFSKQWFRHHGGIKSEAGFDGIETSEGYLVTGITTSSQEGLGGGGLGPYYRIIHDPVKDKVGEVYLLKTDREGNFSYAEAGDNASWQIGTGYLESGWIEEFPNDPGYVPLQNDLGRKIFKIADNNFLVLGIGVRHDNGNGVAGAGNDGVAKSGIIALRLNPNYKMEGNRSGQYITWQGEFKENVLLSKQFFDKMSGFQDVIKTSASYIFVGQKEDNILVVSFAKDDIEE